MCNVDELVARKNAIKKVRQLTRGLCDIEDADARAIVMADISHILDNLEKVINLKMQACGDDQ
jgi:hypothetical protein